MFSFLAVCTPHRWVHLIMPKFKISSKIDLKKMLPKMGISNVFTAAANFSGITEEDFLAIFEVSRAISRVLGNCPCWDGGRKNQPPPSLLFSLPHPS